VIAKQFDAPVKWGTRAKGEHLMVMIEVDQVISAFKQLCADQ
jgi:heptosyltransferase I